MAADARPLLCDLVVGTRPEAIKLGPLIDRLRREPGKFQVRVVTSGQQGDICRSALASFGLEADVSLNPEPADHSLSTLTGAVLRVFAAHFAASPPDILVVQGDTTTAMAATLAGFYAKVPVAHVEAGLRSGDMANPYPEEANRKIIDGLTTVLLPPTAIAQRNLLRAGFDESQCPVTGNTVVDALEMLCRLHPPSLEKTGIDEAELEQHRLVLVTTHRRESWGHDIEAICSAVHLIANRHPDVLIALPVHPNPNVSGSVTRLLGAHPRIRLLPPLDYIPFLALMRRACLILTDSGGIQEEAPSLGVPVLVMRKTTERPEAVDAGFARIVGTDPTAIAKHADDLLRDEGARRRMSASANPFGDGRACDRIAEILDNWKYGRPLLPKGRAFASQRLSPWLPLNVPESRRHPASTPLLHGEFV